MPLNLGAFCVYKCRGGSVRTSNSDEKFEEIKPFFLLTASWRDERREVTKGGSEGHLQLSTFGLVNTEGIQKFSKFIDTLGTEKTDHIVNW